MWILRHDIRLYTYCYWLPDLSQSEEVVTHVRGGCCVSEVLNHNKRTVLPLDFTNFIRINTPSNVYNNEVKKPSLTLFMIFIILLKYSPPLVLYLQACVVQ